MYNAQPTSTRRGFTLVELLVVIAIIGTLVGLLLPAIQAARESSRQATCTNNQKQIATAMQSFATSGSKGAYPGWAQMQKVGPNATNYGVSEIPITWAAKLLPQMDRKGMWDQLVDSNAFDLAKPPKIDEFICPSDVQTDAKLASLTYVVNAGMPDVISSGFLSGGSSSDLKANGICHDQRSGRNGPTVRMGADIKDGATTTLLLSENIHKDVIAGELVGTGAPATWLGPIAANSFDFNPSNPSSSTVLFDLSTNPEQRFGMVWVYDDSAPFAVFANGIQQPINRDGRTDKSAPYGTITGRSGPQFARPAGAHPEIFIAGFCDGGVKTINEGIAFQVYQQLMTPNGAKAAVSSSPGVLIEKPSPVFMAQPLSDSDY